MQRLFSFAVLLILIAGVLLAGTNKWTFIGPAGISAQAIVVDPVSPNLVYAACSGYDYRSTDYGRTWTALSIGGEFFTRIGNWEIDPADHRIVYAGSNRGVFRSTDQGVTWVGIGPRTSSGKAIDVHRVRVKPGDSRTLYATSAGEVLLSGKRAFYKSSNGGATWTTTAEFSGALIDLVTDPLQPDLIYLSENQGLWRSDDSGLTWLPLPSHDSLFPGGPFCVDPTSSRLYSGFSFSDDHGLTWQHMQKPYPLGLNEMTGIALLPSVPSTLYIATRWEGLWRSTDNGSSWTEVSTGAVKAASAAQIVFFPDQPGWILVGCDKIGILRSEDAGETWSVSSSGLRCLMYINDLKIGVEERPGTGTLYAATEWGLFRAAEGGASWKPISQGLHPLGGPYAWVHSVATDPLLAGGLYAATDWALFKSTDFGKNWRIYQPGWFVDLLAHPVRPGQVYAAPYEGLYNFGSDYGVAIDPSNPDVAYRSVAGQLERTTDAGGSWSRFLDYPVSGIAIDPTESRRLYAGSPAGVIRSTDSGKTWVNTSSSGPVSSVAVDPVRPNVIYSGHYGGVERSVDYGATWTPLDHAGLSEEIHALVIDRMDPRILYAAGKNGGVFEMTVTDLALTRPHVTVPDWSTRWAAGTTHFVHWVPTGDGNQVRIEYSTDGGQTYVQAAEAPNTGSYAWQIPLGLDSDRCLLKVTETGSMSDVCDRFFTIIRCLYYLDSETTRFGPIGGQGELRVHADGENDRCDCSATVDSSWIELDPPTVAQGSRSIAFRVLANPSREQRVGLIRVGGLELQILQDANNYFSEADIGLVFPILRQDQSSFTGISLSGFNFAGPLEFDAFDANGNLLALSSNPSLTWVEPGGVFTRLASELVGISTTPQSGWLRALAQGSSSLNGLFLVGNPERMDGGLVQKGFMKEMTFSRVAEGPAVFHGRPARTWISVVNPRPEADTVKLILDDPLAMPPMHVERTQVLAPRGCLQGSISELFGVATAAGYLTVKSVNENSWGFFAYGLIELPDSLISLPPARGADYYSPELNLYSPQFAVTPELFSDLRLLNRENRGVDVVLTWVDDAGANLVAPVTVSVGPRSLYQGTAESIFGVASDRTLVGTLKVAASEGVTGDVVFGTRDLKTAAAVQLKGPGGGVFNHVANGLGCYTGLALFNPNNYPITLHIRVYSTDGTKTGETTLRLDPGQRRSRLVDEWCPETRGQVGGYIKVESDQSFCAQQLFGNGLFLAAVPAGY
jgi:photosystem II stability/assembly factor-like uncharacterized protein